MSALPPPLPPTCCGDEVDQLAGLDLADAVGGDAGGDLHLAAVDRGQHDRRRLQLVLELVHRVAQRLRVGAVEARRQHLDALDVDRLREQVVALRRRQLALERGQLLLERAHLLEHLADARRHLGGRRLQRRRRRRCTRGFERCR